MLDWAENAKETFIKLFLSLKNDRQNTGEWFTKTILQ